jgi:phosphoglycolate phosphatase
MPLKYNNILFDLDGTILDSSADIVLSIQYAFYEVLGRDSLYVDEAYIGLQLNDILLKIDSSLTKSQVEALTLAFRRIYDESDFTNTRLYPGAKETLFIIKNRGAKLFLVTNKPIKPTLSILNKFGLNIFVEVACPDCIPGKRMSKSEMIGHVLNTWGLVKCETIMIGDATQDVIAATKNNIDSGYLLSGYGGRDVPKSLSPNLIVADVRGLMDVL